MVAITREAGPTTRAVTCSAAGACLPCRTKPHLVVDAKNSEANADRRKACSAWSVDVSLASGEHRR